ncbi:MAG: LysM peptidoglycan-binding domain-containing protein [Xanthomonadaceae bacterium]|nr:LysM peptidoglycan-binding domain-containing protein [Xanthomonadaceae bacterium]
MTMVSGKTLLMAALLGLAVSGCATQPAPEATGPTAAELEAERAARAAAEAREADRRALGEARQLIVQARQYTNLNADQQGRLRQADQAINNGEGRRAVELLNRLLSELRSARSTYRVVGGDSLWRIAGRGEVYGNSYQWPLLYKENAAKIQDADLIHPNQELSVVTHPMQNDVDAAVQHARNRGAWEIGRTEDSDRRYLGR